MIQAEKILVRWLSILSAGVSAVTGVLLAAPNQDVTIDQTLLIVLLAVSAFLSAIAATATTQAGSTALGVRKSSD